MFMQNHVHFYIDVYNNLGLFANIPTSLLFAKNSAY